jgi:hypothetical protein
MSMYAIPFLAAGETASDEHFTGRAAWNHEAGGVMRDIRLQAAGIRSECTNNVWNAVSSFAAAKLHTYASPG